MTHTRRRYLTVTAVKSTNQLWGWTKPFTFGERARGF
jgi:hypothetical protein